ncbi:hypothetical protein MESS4_p20042 [Mesorhizobium sp. STM 4661]|nr:hypothetical protein MESS4_p20042 [Mesorhizobium sp. STM 4661]
MPWAAPDARLVLSAAAAKSGQLNCCCATRFTAVNSGAYGRGNIGLGLHGWKPCRR